MKKALGVLVLSTVLMPLAVSSEENTVIVSQVDKVNQIGSETLEKVVTLKNEIENELERLRVERERIEKEKEENLLLFLTSGREHKFNGYNLRTRTNLTGDQLELFLKGTGLEGLGEAYSKAEKEHNVSAFALIGISAVESSWGTSNIAQSKNNLFGYQAYDRDTGMARHFNSKEESILRVAKLLDEDYLSEDGKYHNGYTLASVNIRYASDPEWASKITSVMYNMVDNLDK